MDPILGAAIIGAGASLIGGSRANSAMAAQAGLANATSLKMQRRAALYNAKESRRQFERTRYLGREDRAWRKWMAETQTQRQVNDLRKAGINPILSASLGGSQIPGAGSAGGASAGSIGGGQGVAAQQRDFITPAINTGLEVFRTQQVVNQSRAEVEHINAKIEQIGAQIGLTEQQELSVKQGIEKMKADMGLVEARTTHTEQLNQIKEVFINFLEGINANELSSQIGEGWDMLIGVISDNISDFFKFDMPDRVIQSAKDAWDMLMHEFGIKKPLVGQGGGW